MKKRETSLPLFDEPLQAARAEVVCADVLKWAETYTGPKFHALLTDAPYHLTSGNAVYDLAVTSAGNPRKRRRAQGGGFMGQHWDGMGEDGQGIAFRPETWKALAQHLLPGAFIMAFGSSRGWHRLACAMEDAGLRIYPSIFGWVGAQAFPKASRIDTAVDKAAGMASPILGDRIYADGKPRSNLWTTEGSHEGWKRPSHQHYTGHKPMIGAATPLAQIWAGHRYGGQVLKNSLEPIIVAQVPYAGKPVESIVKHGSGAMNIDGGRIGTTKDVPASPRGAQDRIYGRYGPQDGTEGGHNPNLGRWPSNFLLQHHPACVAQGTRQVRGAGWTDAEQRTKAEGYRWASDGREEGTQHYTDANGLETVQAWACHESCVVRKLDLQAGVRTSGAHKAGDTFSLNRGGYAGGAGQVTLTHDWPASSGNASRFFHVSSWSLDVAERLAQSDPAFYAAKASRSERDKGLDGEPRQRRSAYGEYRVRACNVCGSRRNDGIPYQTTPSCGHEDWSWEEMTAEGSKGGAAKNHHPTVKPIALCRWLATLLLPPAAYAPRRLLNVFSGSGSEGIGALLAGWEEIVMVDSDQSYVDISKQRLAYWSQHKDT